jgi:hypothetical protein
MATVQSEPYASRKTAPTPSSKLFITLANAVHLKERFNGFVSRVQFRRTQCTVTGKGGKISETYASVV